jgi:hypothetical protein
MGKNYSSLLNCIDLFGNAYSCFSWSRPSVLNRKGDRKTAPSSSNTAAKHSVAVSCNKTILRTATTQSVAATANYNARFTANFNKTAFTAVLLFMIGTIGMCAKNVHITKTAPTSTAAFVKNNTIPSLSESTFSNTKSMHFYTYIYVPILQIQNKGDCKKEYSAIKPLIRCNTKMNFTSQNSTVPNPNKNITNLILNT